MRARMTVWRTRQVGKSIGMEQCWRNGWYWHLVWTLKVNFWVLPSKNGSPLNNALSKSLFLFISECDRRIKARKGALSHSKVILWMRYEREWHYGGTEKTEKSGFLPTECSRIGQKLSLSIHLPAKYMTTCCLPLMMCPLFALQLWSLYS